VAYDLRGHGMSEAPLEPEHYTDAHLLADDVAAIIDHLRLDRTVLVGWSYGSFVICDYARVACMDEIGERVGLRRTSNLAPWDPDSRRAAARSEVRSWSQRCAWPRTSAWVSPSSTACTAR
jgi:pimeloyl-ACP methyl ester carboxylesterase